jgi:hypothetical protein
MFGFRKGYTTIDVKFYEGGAAKPFAKSKAPVDRLPDTFEIRTNVTISGEEWVVLGAAPARKEEFRRTGRVRIHVAKPKLLQVPIDELLYSLPSINDDVPAKDNAASLENLLVVHEDDWRQIELVSTRFADKIGSEFDSIRLIHEEHKVGHGFNEIHVRKAIPYPLEGTLFTPLDLSRSFGTDHTYDGVAFSSAAAVVRRGFALRVRGGWTLWGHCSETGSVTVLCCRPATASTTPAFLASFDSFLEQSALFFVDWNRLLAAQTLTGAMAGSSE